MGRWLGPFFELWGERGGEPALGVGFGPTSVKESDFVCILQGAKVPYIVRRIEFGKYKLIGEASVFDVMFGEMEELPKNFEKREIVLV